MLVDETVTVIVQVNGKLRLKKDIASGISNDKLKELVLSDDKLIHWIQGKPVKNLIIVPNKLVNIVV